MKLLSMAIAGATLLGSVAIGTVGASAQGVGVGVGPGGVFVGTDNGYRGDDRYDRRDLRDSRAYYRDRDDETVVIKKKRYREPRREVIIERDRY